MTSIGLIMIFFGCIGIYQLNRMQKLLSQNQEANRTSSVGPVA
jgi:hypothetical protein